MKLILLKNITKVYKTGKSEKKVLNDINLEFDSTGLVFILGKSGSGKSTLLNIIGQFDKPSSGSLISYCKSLSYVFQHYNLLENESALFNVMLPSILDGDSYSLAKGKAENLLKTINIPSNISLHALSSNLSGGEKQRVAVMRAIIKDPQLILADEPTGALDNTNAIKVMEILKKQSKRKLVIVVTHNEELSKQFGDRIIHILDGNIISDEQINPIKEYQTKITKRKRKAGDWKSTILASNFKRRFKRNIGSIISIAFALICSFIITGFSLGAPNSIKNECYKHLDYGSFYIGREIKNQVENSSVSIVKSIRPQMNEVISLLPNTTDYDVFNNYDALFANSNIHYSSILINDFNMSYVKSFLDDSYEKKLLKHGYFPNSDDINSAVVNTKFYNYLKEKINCDPLNKTFTLTSNYETTYYTDDPLIPYIKDAFDFSNEFEIVGVVDELNFLNTNKIFFSYLGLDEFLSEKSLFKLSDYKEENITWKDKITDSSSSDNITSFNYRIFLNDIKNKENIKDLQSFFDDELTITNINIDIESTLNSLIEASIFGLKFFLIIVIVGAILIIGIISYSSYSDDKKQCAILSSLGAKFLDITSLYIIESILLGLFAFVIAILLTLILQNPMNGLLNKILGYSNLINIPFKRYLGKRFLLPYIFLLGTCLSCIFSTFLPILFSKKYSIKDELTGND